MAIEAPNSRFPFSAGVGGQTSSAPSSSEAEICSLDRGMRARGDPCFVVWHRILKQYHMRDDAWDVVVHLHDDNTTCTVCARASKNPTMRTLERCFGVRVGWIYQRVTSGDYNLIHTNTKHMCADIYTKAMPNPVLFNRLRKLINICTEEEVAAGDFNPDVDLSKDVNPEAFTSMDATALNTHYYTAYSSESTHKTDFRKPAKLKPKKKKPPAKLFLS
jgi:hypothetical protein